MPSTSSSVSTVSTSSSSNPAHLLPSESSIKLTTQIESRLPESISAIAAAPDYSINTSASSLSTETFPVPTTYNKFAALSTEIQLSVPLSESATTTSNSEPSNTSKIPQSVTTTTSNTIPATSQDAKQTSKPRRKKRPLKNTSNTIKPKIEIKMAPHKPRKSARVEYTTDEEDMIVYDIFF
ncbi:hypothetical protein TNCV_1722131 [Trichonephila clavipes]|nr:hypothetical protein TNCV_1722131 [Trichonephila clavipes]